MRPNRSFDELRRQMVDEQLRARGIRDERVLHAMSGVPREAFVGDDQVDAAYADCALPIGSGQTISQPFTVAFMCEAAQIAPDDKVLEIGTGSGYGAAVLSCLARAVDTVERLPELADEARRRLNEQGYSRIRVFTADGSLGRPQDAPYDAILVTAGADSLPPALVEQLAPGGRLVIPIGDYADQTMYRFTRTADGMQTENLGEFAFVPLVGAYSHAQRGRTSEHDDFSAR